MQFSFLVLMSPKEESVNVFNPTPKMVLVANFIFSWQMKNKISSTQPTVLHVKRKKKKKRKKFSFTCGTRGVSSSHRYFVSVGV